MQKNVYLCQHGFKKQELIKIKNDRIFIYFFCFIVCFCSKNSFIFFISEKNTSFKNIYLFLIKNGLIDIYIF